jgi:hypothetical protein
MKSSKPFLLAVALIAGCSSESSLKTALSEMAALVPGGTYHDAICQSQVDMLRLAVQSRDNGDSVEAFSAVTLSLAQDLGQETVRAYGKVFKAVWDSEVAAGDIGDLYLSVCLD